MTDTLEATTFEEILAALPYAPRTEHGEGFLAPLARTTGHLLYLLGRLADTPTRRPTDNQITEELSSLSEHLSSFAIPEYMSTAAKNETTAFLSGVHFIRDHFMEWEPDDRITRLRDFDNRVIALHSRLDREVLGIRASDPGQSL